MSSGRPARFSGVPAMIWEKLTAEEQEVVEEGVDEKVEVFYRGKQDFEIDRR